MDPYAIDLDDLCAQFDIVGAVAGWSVAGQRSVVVHGLADHAAGTVLTRDTLMMAGSVTKAMTASIVAMLVDEGLVDLDLPVRTYLPEFRVADHEATRTITTRHLLTHTSGFDGDVWFDVGEGADAIDRFVAELADCRQLSRPGDGFSYNNAAYSVLGLLIQQVTGSSFEGAVQSRLAGPAGASFTTDLAKADGRPAAIGHVPDGSGQQVPIGTAFGPACLAPAGSRTWATIDDLLAFGELHLGRHGGAAEHRALTAMCAPQVFVNDPNNGGTMALGMFLGDRWGTPVVFHDGGVQGQSAYLRILPELDAVLVVMSTGGVPQVFHRHVFARMAEMFPGLHAPLGVEPRPDRTIDLNRYVGRFEAASTRIDVEHDGEGLTAAITWGYDTADAVATGALRLTPHSPEVFLAPLGGRDYVLVYPDLQRPADHLLAGLRRLNRVR
jgi:CubicO group peptidase (beta-lactamase class C family)